MGVNYPQTVCVGDGVVCVRECVRVCVHICVSVCMRVSVRECVRERVHVCVRVCVRVPPQIACFQCKLGSAYIMQNYINKPFLLFYE